MPSSHGSPRSLGFRDLRCYKLAFDLATEIYLMSRSFPLEERFSLTDQIRRSSRSVAANIAEGYRKRQYPRMFASKMADADGEATETQVWIDFAANCGYIAEEQQIRLLTAYEQIGKMLGVMIADPNRFNR
jgi:four helix bundle protein